MLYCGNIHVYIHPNFYTCTYVSRVQAEYFKCSIKLVLVYSQFIVFTIFDFFEMCKFQKWLFFSLNRKARNLFSVSTQHETLTTPVIRYMPFLVFHMWTPFLHAWKSIAGGALIFDEKDLELKAVNILIVKNGLLQVSTYNGMYLYMSWLSLFMLFLI